MKCRVCRSPLPEGAMFCGECGSAVSEEAAPRPRDVRPSDTTVVRPFAAGRPARSRHATPGPAVAGPATVGEEIETVDSPASPDSASPAPVPPAPVSPEPAPSAPVSPAPVSPEPAPPAPAPVTTQPVVREPAVEPIILSVSTGERVTVADGGLLGRRPVPQPGEEVGTIIQVADPGRTVSKTHLEFGFDDGAFWICDRYSGNGTVIQPPSGQARLCEPGHRYRVPRGSRIEIGDQHIDVA